MQTQFASARSCARDLIPALGPNIQAEFFPSEESSVSYTGGACLIAKEHLENHFGGRKAF